MRRSGWRCSARTSSRMSCSWALGAHRQRLGRQAGLAGTPMVAGVLARNMTNDYFVRDGALLFWALAGMLFGYALRRPPASGAGEADPRPARRGIVVGGAAAGERGRERAA